MKNIHSNIPSPLRSCVEEVWIYQGIQGMKVVNDQVYDQVYHQVWFGARNQVCVQVLNQVLNQVWDQDGDTL